LMLRSGQRLVILNYHRAAEGHLRSHLLYLRRHFRLLHLETALEELYAPRKEGSRSRDPRPPLVLTFDDGYYDNYTHAFALARMFQVPITIFLIPGYIEGGNCFWWLDRLVRHAQLDEATLEGQTYRLDRQEERIALAQAIDAHVSKAASTTERENFLASVRRILAVPSSVVLEGEPVPLLKWAEVLEMEGSEWVSFGAHTMHHPILGYLTDPAEVQREVGECRTVLEGQLGHPVRTFAYPYGKSKHIGEHGLHAVRKADYEWAVTSLYGFNTSRTNPYLLRRVFCDVKQHWLVIAAKTSGLSIIATKLSGVSRSLTVVYRKLAQ
jgi:peptidoglycan/xylan/chitin deacetylase (PgdA/CDA1 family)